MGEEPSGETITAWKDGRFQTVAAPLSVTVDLENGTSADDSRKQYDFGLKPEHSFSYIQTSSGLGYIANLSNESSVFEIWFPTEADLLDFMTCRLPAWMGLTSEAKSVMESLSDIRKAAIALCRKEIHGKWHPTEEPEWQQ